MTCVQRAWKSCRRGMGSLAFGRSYIMDHFSMSLHAYHVFIFRHTSIAPAAIYLLSGVPWRFFAASRHDVMRFNSARPEISTPRSQPWPPVAATLSRLGRCRWIHQQFKKKRIRMRKKRRSRAEGIGVSCFVMFCHLRLLFFLTCNCCLV